MFKADTLKIYSITFPISDFVIQNQHYDAIDVICIVKWYYILLSIVYKFVTVNLVSYALRRIFSIVFTFALYIPI